MNKYLKGFIPLFLLIWASCKKDTNDIGINLRNDGGNINTITETITDLICRTVDEDSLRTDSLSANILGATNDPLFGASKAVFVCQPLMAEFGYDFTGAGLDSIVLKLKYLQSQFVDGADRLISYGDLNTVMNLGVYKVDEDLTASRYYSNDNISLGTKIGTYQGTFRFFDSVQVTNQGDTFNSGPELHIRLDDAFGTDLLSQANSVFANQDAWLAYLKGLAIVPDESTLAQGQGAFVGIDFDNPLNGLTVYYDGGESKTFVFNSASKHIGIYEIVNQSAAIQSQKSGTGHFNTTYVQGMGGSKVKVEIPALSQFIENAGQIAISEAKITIPLEQGSYDAVFPPAHRMLLFQPDDNGANSVILDFIDDVSPPRQWFGLTNYGGRYESSIDAYEFHFTRFLQQLVKEYEVSGLNNFNGFYILLPSDFPIVPARSVLNTDLSTGIEVSITYSKLN